MALSGTLRKTHRVVSLIFVGTVVANFVAMAGGKTPPAWVTYAPLMPLAVLTLTGLYMFAVPYLAKARREVPAPGGRREA